MTNPKAKILIFLILSFFNRLALPCTFLQNGVRIFQVVSFRQSLFAFFTLKFFFKDCHSFFSSVRSPTQQQHDSYFICVYCLLSGAVSGGKAVFFFSINLLCSKVVDELFVSHQCPYHIYMLNPTTVGITVTLYFLPALSCLSTPYSSTSAWRAFKRAYQCIKLCLWFQSQSTAAMQQFLAVCILNSSL